MARLAQAAMHAGCWRGGRITSSAWASAVPSGRSRGAPRKRFCETFDALVLARAALTAYRAGAKDALEFISKTTDPFDGRQIRCGFGEDGLVVFWSAGPNGVDDGALPGTDDVVWGLKLDE